MNLLSVVPTSMVNVKLCICRRGSIGIQFNIDVCWTNGDDLRTYDFRSFKIYLQWQTCRENQRGVVAFLRLGLWECWTNRYKEALAQAPSWSGSVCNRFRSVIFGGWFGSQTLFVTPRGVSVSTSLGVYFCPWILNRPPKSISQVGDQDPVSIARLFIDRTNLESYRIF